MCKGSVAATHVADAQEGKTYDIGVSLHQLAVLHPAGIPAMEHVVCVKNGATLTLSGIPPELQTAHGIGDTEIVTFIDTSDNRQDLLEFEDGRRISLWDFANKGVAAYVGVKEIALTPRPAIRAKDLVTA